MDKLNFLILVEKTCDLPSHTLKGNERLNEAEFMDSLSLLALIAMLDKEFCTNMTVDKLIAIGTFNDLHDNLFA